MVDLFWPIRIQGGASLKHETHKNIEIHETNVFKPCENKESNYGIKRRRKFAFVCGGNKPSKWIEAIPQDEEIKRIHKLMEQGMITKEVYEKKVNQILGINEND